MANNLFSYGTLQDEKVQLTLFGRLLKGNKDVLPGFKLEMVTITDEAVLETSQQQQHFIAVRSQYPQDAVPGTVYELTDEELHHADHYEVDDYQRIEVKLLSSTKAWVYVAANRT